MQKDFKKCSIYVNWVFCLNLIGINKIQKVQVISISDVLVPRGILSKNLN